MVAVGTYKEEYIEYKGHRAKVLDRNYVKHTITIEFNGEIRTVNINDIFGMNDKVGYAEHIEYLNKNIEERAERIKENNKVWNICKEAIHNARKGINALFADLGITNKTQIHDEEQMEKYLAYTEDISSARSGQIRASGEILADVNDNISDNSAKHVIELQQLLG